jgi:hypothetical protein
MKFVLIGDNTGRNPEAKRLFRKWVFLNILVGYFVFMGVAGFWGLMSEGVGFLTHAHWYLTLGAFTMFGLWGIRKVWRNYKTGLVKAGIYRWQ